jgi:hypothetical protein
VIVPDKISWNVCQQMLKGKVMQTEEQLGYARSLLLTIVHKMKYDESYRFEQEGEDEATFQEFR